MSKVNYEKIRQDNIEEYGKGTRHLSYFADIYTTRTHFIFELLQNAEDALSRRESSDKQGFVRFHLHPERLEIYHNGKPFDERDIVGICGIGEGTKAGDYTQIGNFGIGFKSVYAYSFFPQIHSENEHFEISRFIEPHEIETTTSKDTLIVLPFDRPEKRPDWAFRENIRADVAESEISQAISKLNIRTLLFLRYIERIEWILANGEQGFLSKKTKQENTQDHWRKVEVSDHQGNSERWMIFSRNISVKDGDKQQTAIVEVAFLLDQNGKVTKAHDTELVVSFPTEKKTELGFLIQAPFKVTKPRDNIKSDDPANHQIIQTAAQIAVDSLTILRDAQSLTIASYNALPLDEDDFSEDNFFRPVYDRIREAFESNSLLPAHGGGFIKADEAKLARSKDLVDLFSPEQLGNLFGKEKLVWLDASITSDAFPEFHNYLRGLVDGIQVTPDSFASKLTADFLCKQSVEWLIKLIQYAEVVKSLKQVPFVRLQTGEHVSLPENSNSKRTAFFAPNQAEKVDLSIFPLVHIELAKNNDVRKFLNKEGVGEVNLVDIVLQSILPKYKNPDLLFNISDYQSDIFQIHKAYTESNITERTRFNKELNNIAWLACVHACGSMSDKVFWKSPGDETLFERNKEHEAWFAGLENVEAYFLHPATAEKLKEITSIQLNPLTKNLSLSDFGTICLVSAIPQSEHWKYLKGASYYQGLNGFKPNVLIHGLEKAFNSWNIDRFRVFWNTLLSAPRIISGEIRSETNKNRLSTATPKLIKTEVGTLCQKHYWMPDKEGNWHKPNELLLTDLPNDFDTDSYRAKEVAEKLGMKKPEARQAIQVLAGDDLRKLSRLERFLSASEDEQEKMLKIIPKEISPKSGLSYKNDFDQLTRPQHGKISLHETLKPNYPINNPDRYQNKVNTETEERIRQYESTPQTIRFSVIHETQSNQYARNFLYEQYQGKCQITGFTFPKASANANGDALNYFEACALLPYNDADYLNSEGNMLSVSADTMAKFKHASFEWIDDFGTAIETFTKRKSGEIEDVKVKIRLANEECEITWSERHFAKLVALYQAGNSIGENS